MTSQTINLDLIPNGVNPVINVSQYDKGQTWLFNILVNGSAFNIPTGSSVTIRGTKRDSTGFVYACSFSGSTVTAIVQDQMTVCSGDQKGELRIEKNGDIIATMNFTIRVKPSALSDTTQISETDLPLIEQAVELMNEAPQIIAQMEGLEQDAEAWAKGTKNGTAVPSSAEQYHNNSYWYAMQAAAAAAHAPIIGNNGNWFLYNTGTGQYEDSGEPSQGDDGVTPVISATASVDANTGTPAVNVTKTGTDAAPSFGFSFQNLKGDKGDTGNTGATGNGIASITKTGTSGLVDTYTITYTNGNTSTFTVTNGQDGTGAGDMTKAVYDSNNAVANAGGIAAYIQDDLITDAQWVQILQYFL
jgi:hypothetical protein